MDDCLKQVYLTEAIDLPDAGVVNIVEEVEELGKVDACRNSR